MRVGIGATLVLVALCCSVGFSADWDFANEFVLGGELDGVWFCLERPSGLYQVPLYIYDPTNPSFESIGSRPVSSINGFECKLEAYGDVAVVGAQYPVPSINVGTGSNFVVGYSEPIPAEAGGYTLLATFDILVSIGFTASAQIPISLLQSPYPCDVISGALVLGPTDRASVPGLMAYLDSDDTDDPLVGVHSARDDMEADLWVEVLTVSVEENSWGAVKALYR